MNNSRNHKGIGQWWTIGVRHHNTITPKLNTQNKIKQWWTVYRSDEARQSQKRAQKLKIRKTLYKAVTENTAIDQGHALRMNDCFKVITLKKKKTNPPAILIDNDIERD